MEDRIDYLISDISSNRLDSYDIITRLEELKVELETLYNTNK